MRQQTEDARLRAQAKTERLTVSQRNGAKATADYTARQGAVLERSAALRALRLAKETAEAAAAAAAVKDKPKRVRVRKPAASHAKA